MNNDELQKALLQAFSEEAPELLQKAQAALLDIESAEGADYAAQQDKLKRALHSLKGSSSAIGRHDLSDLSHYMESFVQNCVADGIGPEQLDILHEGLAYIEANMFDAADTGMLDELINALADQNAETTAKAASSDNHIAPVGRPAGAEVESTESVDNEPLAETEAAVTTQVAAAKAPPMVDETIRVATGKINDIQASVGELIAFDLQQKDNVSFLMSADTMVSDLVRSWLSIRHDVRALQQWLPSRKMSELDSKLGQFSSAVKDIQHDFFQLRSRLGNQNAQFSLLVDEIGVNVRAVRMMPVTPFFESFRAAARDAARQLGKNVVLECVDTDIEVDKMVLEKIKDAVLHIVRNSVSHGIEEPAERQAVGKPEQGRIVLKAGFNGVFVTISIRDDGKGFDRSQMAEKAVSHGLIKPGEELSDQQMLDMICMPGFSTALTINQVAGRGVGMDVVASALTEVGGFLSLETEKDKGSCFELSIPSTLANTQGLMVQVGEYRFGIVLDFVERIVRMRLDRLVEINGQAILYMDQEPVAVSTLAGLMQLDECEPDNAAIIKPILILKAGTQRLALIVDDVPGEVPMMIKTLGPQYEHVDIYAGCTIQSEGTVLPVLNVRAMLQQVGPFNVQSLVVEENNDATSVIDQEQGAATILVVDDSITTRTLERNILEAEDYHVLVATDGVEALEMLRIESDIKLLVTDMEMPRMDGIELCRQVRSSHLANLPIIMVTSVGSSVEKQKALEAGADAYIVKHDFHQDHFLATVRRFINDG